MQDRFCRPINIECIDSEYFPDVTLFMKSNDNYVLYKNHDRKFTENDRARLQRSNVGFLYARTGDMEAISEYMENNLGSLLKRDDASSKTKGKILYQTAVNYIHDIFESPEKAADLPRCQNIIRNLTRYATTCKDAMASFQHVIPHNYYIFVHSVQMATLSLLMHSEIFQSNDDELMDAGIGSILHDFGMLFISNDIMDKPDALSDVEYYKVKQHTTKGYEQLKNLGIFSSATLSIIRLHHERYDGNGYPVGLKGNDIPRNAQLAAICDTYCAMTTNRPYKEGIPSAKALKIMREELAGQFNRELFRQFEEIITSRE